jgi:hypothetical protein
MPRGKIAAITPKNEPLTAGLLIGRELPHLGLHRVVVERFREAIPDVDVAGSEGAGTQSARPERTVRVSNHDSHSDSKAPLVPRRSPAARR